MWSLNLKQGTRSFITAPDPGPRQHGHRVCPQSRGPQTLPSLPPPGTKLHFKEETALPPIKQNLLGEIFYDLLWLQESA